MNITYKFNLPPTLVSVRDNREKILNLEDALARAIAGGELEGNLDECKVSHAFTTGACARTMVIPQGTIIVGKIHKHAHFNFIMRGKVAVMTPNEGVQTLTAPYTFISTPGTKRAVYALEETEWTCIHVTDETDLAKLEDHVIAKSFQDYDRLAYSGSQPIEINYSGEP